MNKALRVADYLEHILNAIVRIQSYTEDVAELEFLQQTLIQDAVIRNMEVIGEAAHNILEVNPTFAEQHNEVPWLEMYAMRNRLSHGYDRIDMELVWRTIEKDLPDLHRFVQAIKF